MKKRKKREEEEKEKEKEAHYPMNIILLLKRVHCFIYACASLFNKCPDNDIFHSFFSSKRGNCIVILQVYQSTDTYTYPILSGRSRLCFACNSRLFFACCRGFDNNLKCLLKYK